MQTLPPSGLLASQFSPRLPVCMPPETRQAQTSEPMVHIIRFFKRRSEAIGFVSRQPERRERTGVLRLELRSAAHALHKPGSAGHLRVDPGDPPAALSKLRLRRILRRFPRCASDSHPAPPARPGAAAASGRTSRSEPQLGTQPRCAGRFETQAGSKAAWRGGEAAGKRRAWAGPRLRRGQGCGRGGAGGVAGVSVGCRAFQSSRRGASVPRPRATHGAVGPRWPPALQSPEGKST